MAAYRGRSTKSLGVTPMTGVWDIGQRFSLRVSTMLLLWVLLPAVVAASQKFLPGPLSIWTSRGLQLFGPTTPFILLFAAIFSLAFFLTSLYRRKPQVQYLVEFGLGAAALLLLGVS
jgi:hypothetical protein